MEKFYFPMETMNVTQNYNGTVSHKPHWYGSKNYADYPIDIAGVDDGQSAVFAPVKMKVNNIIGIGSSVTNTIWLESVNQVQTPSGVCKVFMALTHWNDEDSAIKKHPVGSIVNAGEIICYEGKDGASANHIHMVVGNADKGTGNKLIQNSNGKWVSNGYGMKPEELMYINDGFTVCKNSGGLVFKSMSNDEIYKKGDSGQKIAEFCNYFSEKVKGNYFGDYLEACVKVFQAQNGLRVTGMIDQATLDKLK